MLKEMKRYGGALFFAGVLALAGCSGDDGSIGPAGPAGADGADGTDGTNGTNGTDGAAGKDASAIAKAESCAVCHAGAGPKHQAIYNDFVDGLVASTSNLTATIDGVVTDLATQTSTLTFTIKQNGVPYTGSLGALGQKSFSAVEYVPSATAGVNGKFTKFFSYSAATAAPTGVPGQFTVKNDTVGNPAKNVAPVFATFAPENPANAAFVYAYFGDTTVIPNPNPTRRYSMMDNTASAAKVYGAIDFVSTVKSTSCEKCHPSPYPKHGIRMGAVAGLPDMAACKACHSDERAGGHQDWQCLVEDPAAYAAGTCKTTKPWTDGNYEYLATTMNDTHMSHAMEFVYPQSMANCVTCHEGKLDLILTDANFTLKTCRSCHPFTAVAGTDPKRAPALDKVLPPIHGNMLAGRNLDYACNSCHKAGTGFPVFTDVHSGYNARIYDNAGAKLSATIKASIGAVTFDAATKILTIPFKMEGTAANAIVKPTVVISLYGYNTKDFVVGGHSSQPDGKRSLEWTEGATNNSPRLTVTPNATAGNTEWVAKADLSVWAAKLADASVKRAEIGVLPALGIDQTKAPQNTATNADGSARADFNPYLAVAGATATYDLVAKAVDTKPYGKDIVDASKCNRCHEALGTTFHSPAYGSAGVVGCRLCHVVGSGGSHLEMQSRSIDSYVHAIHAMQPFDIGSVDFADPVDALHYEHHIESVYPNFTVLNCESCHNAGKYDVPDQARSLPGLTSKAATLKGATRNIGAVPAYVTGPASRACGSCHRAKMINEDQAGELAAFNEHTASFGTLIDATDSGTSKLDQAIQKIMALFK